MHSVAAYGLYINVGNGIFVAACIAVALSQDVSVLADYVFSVEYEVGRRFAESGRGVYVAAQASSRLLFDERQQIGEFARDVV